MADSTSQDKTRQEFAQLLEMGEQRQRTLLEEQVRQLRENLAIVEAQLAQAKSEAVVADERSRALHHEIGHLKEQLCSTRTNSELAQTVLRQELATVSATAATQAANAEARAEDLRVALASAQREALSIGSICSEQVAELELLRTAAKSSARERDEKAQALEKKWVAKLAEQKEGLERKLLEQQAAFEQTRQVSVISCDLSDYMPALTLLLYYRGSWTRARMRLLHSSAKSKLLHCERKRRRTRPRARIRRSLS
jgi:hypothetical protein